METMVVSYICFVFALQTSRVVTTYVGGLCCLAKVVLRDN
jgi:hypothetical protein